MGEIVVLLPLVVMQFLLLCDSEFHIHCKFRADSFDRTDYDTPVHHIHNVFGYGKPKPCPSVKGSRPCTLLGKWFKYMGNKFLIHPHSGVIDDKAEDRIVFRPAHLGRRKGHFSALSGKFNGIGKDIDEHLLQLHGISHVIVVQHRVHNTLVIHALGGCLGMADGVDPV